MTNRPTLDTPTAGPGLGARRTELGTAQTEQEFIVVWDIDILAADPGSAAEQALRIQRDPDSHATVFVVFGAGRRWRVDAVTEDCTEETLAPGPASPHDVTDDELARVARSGGLSAADLDDAVHDAASRTASDVNNGGLAAQVAFLRSQYGLTETLRCLEALTTADPDAPGTPPGRNRGGMR